MVLPLFPISVSLSGEPAGKGRPRFVRATGRTYTPDKTRRVEDMLRLLAQEQTQGAPPYDGPVEVEVTALFSVPKSFSAKKRAAALAGALRPTKKPDADNMLKLADALNGVVFRDDAQVVSARVQKLYAEAPSLTLTVRRIYTAAA